MSEKIWQAEAIRNHLLAVRAWMQDSTLPALMADKDSHLAAYRQGGEAALRYLAERFGVTLNGSPANKQPQTGELRLKTWTCEDIKSILEVAWQVMHEGGILSPDQDTRVRAFYCGLDKAISAVVLSFDIKDFKVGQG